MCGIKARVWQFSFHRRNDPGHGPNFRLTFNYHHFRGLSQSLVEGDEKICRLRPSQELPEMSVKKVEAIQREISQEVDRLGRGILTEQLETGRIDLEAVAMGVRTAMHHTGASTLTENAERMRYSQFRSQRLFVGTGVIEAGCKTVIGSRLKQSGMFSTVRGANTFIPCGVARISGRFEDYWEARRA